MPASHQPHAARDLGQDGQPRPRVTVIVPVWNGASTIADCLAALLAQDYPRDRYQVLVVDNGSTDGTTSLVRRFDTVRLLHESEPGSYAARNRGLSEAAGQFVAFTDADCTPEPGWLSAAIDTALMFPEAGVIGGPIELYAPPGGSSAVSQYEYLFAFKQESYLARGYCTTANWLSPLVLLKGLNGFDARLRSGGDFELCQRVRASGAPVIYAAGMVVRHPARRSIADLARKHRRLTGGRWMRLPGNKARLRSFLGIVNRCKNGIANTISEDGLSVSGKISVCLIVVWLSLNALAQSALMLVGATAPRS